MKDFEYFEWVSGLVMTDEHMLLLEQLYNTPFDENSALLIPNDINRIVDAKDLPNRLNCEWRYKDVSFDHRTSVLEVLVTLAIRIEEWVGIKCYYDWFWEMIDNLGLSKYTDELYLTHPTSTKRKVSDIINLLLQRQYQVDGRGGLFPLNHIDKNLKNVEIWMQMSWYITEKYPD